MDSGYILMVLGRILLGLSLGVVLIGIYGYIIFYILSSQRKQVINNLSNLLIDANKQLCQKFGGVHSLIKPNELETIVVSPWQVTFDKPVYKEDIDKINYVASSIIHHHPFGDGNKRVALVAVEIFADLFFIKWDFSPQEKYAFIMKLAGSQQQDNIPISLIPSNFYISESNKIRTIEQIIQQNEKVLEMLDNADVEIFDEG